ncbi:MAG: GAF domain-containing protein [Arenicellales bacterium]
MANPEIDLIKKVFERRLQQSDLDEILAALSSTERDELIGTIGQFLLRISTLVEISSRTSDSLSLDVLLPRLMDIVTEAMNADRSTLFVYDPDTDELFSRVLQGDSIGDIRFPSRLGVAGAVFHERKAAVISDAYGDPRFNPDFDRETGYKTRNMLCVPVLAKDGQAIGVFQVLNRRKGHFDDSDLALLEALTSQAASALENARLFEEVQRQQREEAQLLEVNEVISSNLQLDELLNQVISIVTDMLNADRSSLFIYDSRTGELWSQVAEGLEKEIRFPSSAGIAGSCFTSGQSINIPDTYADERFNPDVDRNTGYRTRNMLCMPIANKSGRKLGVLQVLNKRKGPFNRNDENRLRAFSYQVAIALENAQLFEDVLNERNYNESILRSLSNGVMTLSADLIVIKANDALTRILHRQKDDIANRSVSNVFSQDQNRWILDSIENVKRSGETDITMDADILLGDGGSSSVNLTVVPLVNIGKEQIGFMLVFEDITREKRIKSTMARYMTKEVADRLLDVGGEDALGGAAQLATVLFSDIRDFTTIAEELGPRQTVSLLNEYFTDMIDVIFSHGGILDKYIGDAIMAVFGTPFESPKDADNAVLVANEMMGVLRIFNEKRRKEEKVELRIGVGMATGELVSGNIGSLKRMDYTAIGDTVNLASRLEGATKYYGVNILWSEATAKALTNPVRCREVDLIRVKGKNKPVSIFEGLDYHSTGSFPSLDRVLDRFQQGIDLYRKRDWKKAIGCFESTLDLHRGDMPSQIYLKRCRHYQDTPPPDDWDGVWVMTEK